MVNALLALLTLQLVGEVLVRALGLPIPGPVVGMLLLFIGLRWRGAVPAALQRTADGLLGNLSLLFVPAGVGVVAHLALLRAAWWQLPLTVVVSTLITLTVTALIMQTMLLLQTRLGRKR